MTMSLTQFWESKPKPVAVCQDGGHPIYGNPISSDFPAYRMLDGKPICFEHYAKRQLPEIENAGRGSPHGGCHGD